MPGAPPDDSTPVNVWAPVSAAGYLAAEVTEADDSLYSAVAGAASAAGGQAALVAGTVGLRGNVISAGGDTPVGRRGVTASIMALGSEGGSKSQFRRAPWFYPAVAAWAAAHPPKTESDGDGPSSAQGERSAVSGAPPAGSSRTAGTPVDAAVAGWGAH